MLGEDPLNTSFAYTVTRMRKRISSEVQYLLWFGAELLEHETTAYSPVVVNTRLMSYDALQTPWHVCNLYTESSV